MAFKLYRSGEYVDRPLLTEKEIKFILVLLENVTTEDAKIQAQKSELVAKLLRSKIRIDKIK